MTAITAVAIAILNSLWQAALVAALAYAAMKLAPRINAATRYVIWWIVLAMVILLPIAPRMRISRSKTSQPAAVIAPQPTGLRHLKTPVLIAPGAYTTLRQEPTAKWPYWILFSSATLFLYRFGQTCRSYAYLRGLKRRAKISVLPRSSAPRRARLLESDEIESPIAVGFVHPAILLPASLPYELAPAELDHVLLHEAAHIARWDDWSNLFARFVGAVFALHPIVLLILWRIEYEREIACDDWAVARIGAARPYAESLAYICEMRWAQRNELLAHGVRGWRPTISRRIEMLLRRGRDFAPHASRPRVLVSGAMLLALLTAASFAPRWIGFAQRLEFEVASIKHNTNNGDTDDVPRRSGNHVIIHNNQLGNVILYAYNLKYFQVVGNLRLPPGWNWYDIDATVSGSPNDDQVRLMLQSLLEDRFKLKVNRETRQMDVYKLVIAKNGPKIKRADENSKLTIDNKPLFKGEYRVVLGVDGTHLMGKGATIAQMISSLIGYMVAPVIDDTGLQGEFDYDVVFERQKDPDDLNPPLPAALQSTLGLKLERSKGPFEVLVIDHLEKPTPN